MVRALLLCIVLMVAQRQSCGVGLRFEIDRLPMYHNRLDIFNKQLCHDHNPTPQITTSTTPRARKHSALYAPAKFVDLAFFLLNLYNTTPPLHSVPYNPIQALSFCVPSQRPRFKNPRFRNPTLLFTPASHPQAPLALRPSLLPKACSRP